MTAAPVLPAVARWEPRPGLLTLPREFGIRVPDALVEVARVAFPVREWARAPEARLVPLDAPGEVLASLQSPDPERFPPASGTRADGADGVSEAYELVLDPDGARLSASTAEGVFRGLTTLRLLAANGDGIPCGRIRDAPRFAWRGLSLDVVRCFHPPATVRRVVDICAELKLNVLHLHLTDDEGWRLPVPDWPALADAGVTGDPRTFGSYSTQELAELDAYAAERFVTLVPEIDMPAHSAAAIRAFPELGERNTLHVGDPVVARFVSDAVSAAAAAFPRSAFVHVGGDEAFGLSTAEHARFMAGAADAVRALGRRALGWQEFARADPRSGDLVQYWMDPSEMGDADGSADSAEDAVVRAAYATAEGDVARARAAGVRIIASPSARTYLDRPFAADSVDPDQTARRPRIGLPVYPETPLLDSVDWEPTEVAGGVPEDAIAGVEAAVWCETVVAAEDLELLLLPRLALVAERAWVPRGAVDADELRARVARAGAGWSARGWSWYRSRELVDR